MGKILYIDNKLCSNIEQLRSYFNAPINYGSNIFMDILDYGRSGDLSSWLREHEENELALNIDDIDSNIGDGEYISRITDIINNHLFSHKTSSSLKPEPLQCFTIEDIKVGEDDSKFNVTISLKNLQTVNEWYNIELKTLSGATSKPRRLNPYDYKVGKVINIKFDFPLLSFDKSEIRVFVDGVELEKSANNKTHNVNKSQIVVCSRSESFIRIWQRLDNVKTREIRIGLRKGENIISVKDYPELRYGFSFDRDTDNPEYIENIILDEFDTSNVTSMRFMFFGCESLKTLDLSNFDTSNVTDMSIMFSDCKSLGTLDLSSFDTSKVTDMVNMFSGCRSLETLDLGSFDTSNVTDMSIMFSDCSSLETLDLSNFDTSNVTNMGFMFHGCSSLETLGLSNFDTSNTICMYSMFSGCSSLETLDLSSFDTSKVIYMGLMFSDCSSLETLDLSSFDTSKVTDMDSMFFYGCVSLKKVIMRGCSKNTIDDITKVLEKAGINAKIITD